MSPVHPLLLQRIGETDCETIGAGLLAQPANSISSGAYFLAGAWLAVLAARSNSPEQRIAIVYGIALALVGAGSIAFHGPMPPGARLIHDLSIAAVLALVATRNVGRLRRWPESVTLAIAAAFTGLIGAVMAVSPGTGIVLIGAAGVTALGLEVALYRVGRRPPLATSAQRRLGAGLVLLGLGGLLNLLGRTGGPLCDPEALLQGHAVWHLLTAAAFGVYGWVSFDIGPRTARGE